MATAAPAGERLITLDEFLKFPEDGISRELAKGKVIEMPQSKPIHGYVCTEVAARLREFVKAHDLGRVIGESGVITERAPDSMRGPDVSFYSFERLPRGKMPEGYLDVLPELVVEVLSSFDRWPRVLEKIVEYLDAGVRVVCIIDPDAQTAQVHTADAAVQYLTRDDELTLNPLFTGFRCRVGELFE